MPERSSSKPSFRTLPAGTIVIAVVDPGVGSLRRGVAIEAGGLRFVGPDNGLFSFALARSPRAMRPFRSRSADLRATASAARSRVETASHRQLRGSRVARNSPGELGPAVKDLVELTLPPATKSPDGIDGVVLRVDHFGNLITNIDDDGLLALGSGVTIEVAGATIDGLAGTYADVAQGALCALVGSTGRLEISVNGGSAAAVLNAARGSSARVRLRSGA